MARLTPVSFNELVQGLKRFGFHGPYAGGKHQYMIRGNSRINLPNPHKNEISIDLLKRILRRARISREEWLKDE